MHVLTQYKPIHAYHSLPPHNSYFTLTTMYYLLCTLKLTTHDFLLATIYYLLWTIY